MATVERTCAGESRFLLEGVDWATYEALRDIEDNWHVRMTYDRGRLELMSPSQRHESLKKWIAQLVELLTLELNIPRMSAGSTTWKKPELAKALEADECYYVLREQAVRDREEIDLATDPPPDLAIEVEVSRSAIARMKLYAALGVPEVWRWRREELRSYELKPNGKYVERESSLNLPFLRVADLTPFLVRRSGQDETSRMREFQVWVREKFGQRGKPTKKRRP